MIRISLRREERCKCCAAWEVWVVLQAWENKPLCRSA